MHILVFNGGSSSLRFKVYETSDDDPPGTIASGKASNVGTHTRAGSVVDWEVRGTAGTTPGALPTQRAAAQAILAILDEHHVPVDAIGHRFVHGGPRLDRTTRVDDATMEALQACAPFAPIHNPNALSVIELCREALPGVPEYAVFDTSFHAGMPEAAREYAIPRDLAERHGFRRYGFHGLSYAYVSARTAELMGAPLGQLKLILCHLGTGGSSVAAVKAGRSIDTSMGYSPLPGLVMSTRSGDLDPEIVVELVRDGASADEVDRILNDRSGLLGLSGFSSDLLEIIDAAAQGNAGCRLAFDVYAHRLSAYLGAYTWLLDGADAIVFTDDVGLRAWQLREAACGSAGNLGVVLDRERNRSAAGDRPALVSAPDSRTQVWVVPTDEEIVILREVVAQLRAPA